MNWAKLRQQTKRRWRQWNTETPICFSFHSAFTTSVFHMFAEAIYITDQRNSGQDVFLGLK